MRALCLVLLLTACASPQRGEYRQSAAPMASAFNPAWDAPHTVGQPGYLGAPESAPRSTHKRYLPPTKEPGLWAGDGARASASLPQTMEVLGVSVPLPDAFESGSNPAAHCAVVVAHGAKTGLRLQEAIDALSLGDRLCFVTDAMLTCMHWRQIRNKDRAKDSMGANTSLVYSQFSRDIDAVIGRIGKHERIVCGEARLRRLADLLDRWRISAFTDPPPTSGMPQ